MINFEIEKQLDISAFLPDSLSYFESWVIAPFTKIKL